MNKEVIGEVVDAERDNYRDEPDTQRAAIYASQSSAATSRDVGDSYAAPAEVKRRACDSEERQ